jgi:N-formylglutamate amidohydrolase
VAVTFKLTGAFSQAAYDGYVRPNMFEASEGFSGLWSHDHDYLVKQILRDLKPIFSDPPAQLAESMQKFRQAFAIMYDAHRYVCERFEGDAPSLLMGEEAQKSAGEMIETFKRNRLRVLGVD